MFSRHNSSEPALHINEIDVNDKYKFLKKIGQGSYGEVWLVLPKKKSTNKTVTKQYVLKRLDLRQSLNTPTQNDIESAEREAKLLSTLEHPNIVAYTESFRSNDGFLNIVMAYCEGGDLYTRLKEKKMKKEFLSEDQIIEWFIQICMALQYIHEKNILHRDLKTQNIFLTKNEIIKVGDLGIARVLQSGNDFATTIVGTPYYMSPEIFSHKPYGQKSDIWSLGCCVYEMITLQHAFNAKDMDSLMSKIIRGQTPQLSKGYSQELGDILSSMLKKEPRERPTAKSILQLTYIKKHIIRLLEKAQAQHKSQVNSKSQPAINVSPVSSPSRSNSASNSHATSATNSPPSRPTSASKVQATSATNSPPSRPISPSNSSPSKHRSSDYSNPPILRSIPVVPLSAHSRSSSSRDINRSKPIVAPLPSNEPKLSESRVRRRRNIQACRSNPLPMNNQMKDLEFLSNLSQNDTLQRFKRDQQIKKPLKQYQQRSSSDEQETSPIRPLDENICQPVIVQKLPRKTSTESNINSFKPPSYPSTNNSYDSHPGSKSSIPRQRRRENKSQTSSGEYNESSNQIEINNNQLLPSVSQENLKEIEQKKENEREMDQFVLMLTTTLQLENNNIPRLNELNDNKRQIIEEEEEDTQMIGWTSGERTIAGPLHETNYLHQRCQLIREECLREISPNRLKRVLRILDNVSDVQLTQEMINELGKDLYNKYSAQIFSLKFYEDTLSKRT